MAAALQAAALENANEAMQAGVAEAYAAGDAAGAAAAGADAGTKLVAAMASMEESGATPEQKQQQVAALVDAMKTDMMESIDQQQAAWNAAAEERQSALAAQLSARAIIQRERSVMTSTERERQGNQESDELYPYTDGDDDEESIATQENPDKEDETVPALTPLCWAAHSGRADILRLLLKVGCPPCSCCCPASRCYIHLAAAEPSPAVVLCLLRVLLLTLRTRCLFYGSTARWWTRPRATTPRRSCSPPRRYDTTAYICMCCRCCRLMVTAVCAGCCCASACVLRPL